MWRQTDMEMCLEKIDWYKQKSAKLKELYEQERESALLMRANADAELQKLEDESNDLIDQKAYIDQGKKRLERSILDEQVAKKHVEDRIEEAKNRQRELRSQLENLKIKLDQKRKQKEGFEAQLAQLNETNEWINCSDRF